MTPPSVRALIAPGPETTAGLAGVRAPPHPACVLTCHLASWTRSRHRRSGQTSGARRSTGRPLQTVRDVLKAHHQTLGCEVGDTDRGVRDICPVEWLKRSSILIGLRLLVVHLHLPKHLCSLMPDNHAEISRGN